MPHKDPEARRSYNSQYQKDQYQKNKKKKIEQSQIHKKASIKRNNAYTLEHRRSHPCIRCGEDNPLCLSVHHIRGGKIGNVSDLANKGWSIASIDAKIAKCEVICHNCHAIESAEQRETKKKQ